MTFRIPVLILGFNRPQFLGELIDELRPLRPERIYVAIDGPRVGNDEDLFLVSESQACVNRIDWPCEVRTLSREENVGCGRAVSDALDWVFSNEEMAVILEDDVRPSRYFFDFCEKMLEMYMVDKDVGVVSGFDPMSGRLPADAYGGFRFSRVPQVWGWATWRDRWEDYEFDIRRWWTRISFRDFAALTSMRPGAILYWVRNFSRVANGTLDTWDFQLTLSLLNKKRLSVIPNGSLTYNVGNGDSATHTKTLPVQVPLAPVCDVVLERLPVATDAVADRWLARSHFNALAKLSSRSLSSMTRGRRLRTIE